MKVEVYWNLHKNKYSVRHKGKVIAHETRLYIQDAKFVVQPAGRERVRKEKRKNVHAFIRGTWVKSIPKIDTVPVTYNPYKYETFMQEDEPIHQSDYVFCAIKKEKPYVYAERSTAS